ncbi:fluoride efflux transporter CrcB [Streptomyces sp. JNUCC 64]
MNPAGGAASWLLVLGGAAVGAPLRYLTDRAIRSRYDTLFPWGTFAVNVTGCLVLGVLTGAALGGAVGPGALTLFGTGLCGALTTYSTFSYETLRLAEEGATGRAALNAVGSVAAGVAAAFAGAALGGWLWG